MEIWQCMNFLPLADWISHDEVGSGQMNLNIMSVSIKTHISVLVLEEVASHLRPTARLIFISVFTKSEGNTFQSYFVTALFHIVAEMFNGYLPL